MHPPLRHHSARFASLVILVLTFFLIPSLSYADSSAAKFSATPSPVLSTDLISNGQFVFGPAARRFDLTGYLRQYGSPLLADAALIEGRCAYASINPQVVLVLLELDGQQVTQGWQAPLTQDERTKAVEDMVMGLAERFYGHLYRYGERAPAAVRTRPLPSVTLAGGATVNVSLASSSASFAVTGILAQGLSPAQFAAAVDPADPAGFTHTWVRLFPATDPLDTSVSITPQALPPADLLQFPFPLGQRWWFNGAHNWNGSGVTYGKPYSSMDFFTSADSCSLPPGGDWAVAAAGGTGYHPSGAACWYRIDHSGGWTTSYYHLRNVVPNGAMTANGKIGTIACEICVGGYASGPHVHFSLLYNGAYVDLEGVQLSGWAVHSGNGDYQTGSLERNGVRLNPYSAVTNEGVKTTTPTPTRSPTATLTPTSTGTLTFTPTATTTRAVTPSPTASRTPTATPTPTSTWEPGVTPTVTNTPTATLSPTATATPTASAAITATPSPTETATPSATPSPTATAMPTASATPTATPSPIATATPTATRTPAPSPVARFISPEAKGLIRTCPVRLLADVSVPGSAASVTFWARYGGALHPIGRDDNASDGWEADWDCQDAPDGSATLSLSVIDGAGQKVIDDGGAVQVTVSKDCNEGTYRTAFFANAMLSGAPTSSWCKATGISYNWGTGAPGAGVPGADDFSARFRGDFLFERGVYRFAGQADDGVRVWVDRALVVDDWHDHQAGVESYQFVREMSAGLHDIRVDYYERNGVAAVSLAWERSNIVMRHTYLPMVIAAN